MAVEIAVRCSVCRTYVGPEECAHFVGKLYSGYEGELLGDGEYLFCSLECLANFCRVPSSDAMDGGVPFGDHPIEGDVLPPVEDVVPTPAPPLIQREEPERRTAPQRKSQPRKPQQVKKELPPPPVRTERREEMSQAPKGPETNYTPPEDIRYLLEPIPPPEKKLPYGKEVPAQFSGMIPTEEEKGQTALLESKVMSGIRRSYEQ